MYRLWFSLSDRDKCYSDRYYNLWCVVKPSESDREQVKLNELLSILQFSDKDTDWTYWPLSDSCGSRKFAIFCNTLDQDNRLSLCIFWLVHFCFHAICELTHLLANNGYFSSDHLVTQSGICLSPYVGYTGMFGIDAQLSCTGEKNIVLWRLKKEIRFCQNC